MTSICSQEKDVGENSMRLLLCIKARSSNLSRIVHTNERTWATFACMHDTKLLHREGRVSPAISCSSLTVFNTVLALVHFIRAPALRCIALCLAPDSPKPRTGRLRCHF
jgi:hypothetical protein